MQKTITIDYLTHRTKKNEGEMDQFYIKDHHDAIINREIWEIAQDMLDNLPGRRRKKPKKQQRLTAVSSGLLQGFVPIRPEWKTISHARLWSATARAWGEYNSEVSDTEENTNGAEEAPESEE